MMASTTVFVLEPGVTALGNHQTGNSAPDDGDGDGGVEAA